MKANAAVQSSSGSSRSRWLYAAYENTRWSTREIEPFIRKYHIDMSEFEAIEYRSFAEFFDRFKPGARKFPRPPGEIGAFAEARYFAWDRWEAEQGFPVKGQSLRADESAVHDDTEIGQLTAVR